MKSKSILRILLITVLILLIPLALTILNILGGGVEGQGWYWKVGDFIVMGALLFGAGIAIDLAVRKLVSPIYRIIAVVSIVVVLLLVWAELAVGIFGTPFAGS